MDRPEPATSGLRYGDFPELFWDLRGDAPIDAEHPSILARLLESATPETIGRLVSLDTIRDALDALPVPQHTRRFWRIVVDRSRPERLPRSG